MLRLLVAQALPLPPHLRRDGRPLPVELVDGLGHVGESFFKDCLNQGIYFAPSKYEAGFISTKHTKKILDEVINKVKVIYGT